MLELAKRARVLITGWPSFVHGEATAGDVLAMEAARDALSAAGFLCDLAWSPVFRPGSLTLEAADPGRYTHLVFCCGPAHGRPVEDLHRRFARCTRIAVGVSVIDPAGPAAAGFEAIIPRDGADGEPRRDLAAEVGVPPKPVVGVVLAPAQPEYGSRGRHQKITAKLTRWLGSKECGWVPIDTRLDSRGWPAHGSAAQVEAVIARMDLVVTTRLHGLVLALKNGVPALAVDPVAGGAKVAAQAWAWQWPVVVSSDGPPPTTALDQQWQWCLSAQARRRAAERRAGGAGPPARARGNPLTADLLRLLGNSPTPRGSELAENARHRGAEGFASPPEPLRPQRASQDR